MTTTTRRPPGATPPPKSRRARRSPDPGKTGEPGNGREHEATSTPERPAGQAAAATTAKQVKRRTHPAPEETGPGGAAKRGGSAKAPVKASAKQAAPAREAASDAAEKGTRNRAGARPARGVVAQAPPRTPFVLLIVGLLGGALVSLLLLNTVLAQDAFTLTRLQQSNKLLEQQRQAYQEEIAREESPEGLARKAKALGMKEAEQPAFVDGVTGRTTGGNIRPVPYSAAASAGAASVLGVPGTVVPGDGIPVPAAGRNTTQGGGSAQGGRQQSGQQQQGEQGRQRGGQQGTGAP